MKKDTLSTIIRWLVVIATPFLLTILTVRMLIAWDIPGYPIFAYSLIAPDTNGFSDEERIELANATLDYLQRGEPANEVIHLLVDLKLPGTSNPLYGIEEIDHMLDVKIIADKFKWAMWMLLVVVIGGLVLLMTRLETPRFGYATIIYGGVFTMVILVFFIVLVGVSWNFVFTQFHILLFPPDSWQFSNSSSLIRLFPERFWFIFAILWIVCIFLQAIFWTVIGYKMMLSEDRKLGKVA